MHTYTQRYYTCMHACTHTHNVIHKMRDQPLYQLWSGADDMLSLLVLYQIEMLQSADYILHLDCCHLTQLLQANRPLIVLQHLRADTPDATSPAQDTWALTRREELKTAATGLRSPCNTEAKCSIVALRQEVDGLTYALFNVDTANRIWKTNRTSGM